jgi:hypothetical protein
MDKKINPILLLLPGNVGWTGWNRIPGTQHGKKKYQTTKTTA